MAYKWTDSPLIQLYLDSANAHIQIGDESEATDVANFSNNAAEEFENESVFEIETILSAGWETPLPGNKNGDLKRLAARLTAAKIGETRLATSVGGIAEWISGYKNHVFAQLLRMLVNHETVEIEDAEKRFDVDISDILIKAKTRELMFSRDV